MKILLYCSLLLNILALGAGGFAIHRLGGWDYAKLRLQPLTEGLYHHRVGHFEKLDERPGCIIFLGDSQTEQAEWHELFGTTSMVLNRGVSGDFTQGILDRLPEILRHKPQKVFLLVGVNDLIFGNEVSEIEVVYRSIVQKIRSESPDTELYLQSVLPLNNLLRKTGTSNEKVLELNARILQIAHDYALPYLDIGTPLKDADGNLAVKFSEDGLHLNGLGYVVWKNQIEQYVKSNNQ